MSVSAVYQALKRFYINQGNYYKRTKLVASTAGASASLATAAGAPSQLTGAGPTSSQLAPDSSPDAKSRSILSVLRTIIIFQGQLPARELFAHEHEEAVASEMSRLRQEMPSADLRKLEAEMQELYQKKITDLANNVARNQSEFALLLVQALQDICDRRYLGSALLGVLFAFRETSDNIQHGLLYAGFNAESSTRIGHRLKNHDQILREWCTHADIMLPRHNLLPESMSITYRADGLPVLPNLDLRTATLGHLQSILHNYLAKCWNCVWPSDDVIASIPYADIAKKPELYYDIAKFTLPGPIVDPTTITFTSVIPMWTALWNLCESPTPFRFFYKPTIRENVANELQKTVNDIEKDDKIEDTNTEPVNVDDNDKIEDTNTETANVDGFEDNDEIEQTNAEPVDKDGGKMKERENNFEDIPIGLLPPLDANQAVSVIATVGSNCPTPELSRSTKELECNSAPESPLSDLESAATPSRSSRNESGEMPQVPASSKTVGTGGTTGRGSGDGSPGGDGRGISNTAGRGTVSGGGGGGGGGRGHGHGRGRGGRGCSGMSTATDEPRRSGRPKNQANNDPKLIAGGKRSPVNRK
ncbi:hypothetical protein MD484_g6882, partial [Candolleomyces efflorescens]